MKVLKKCMTQQICTFITDKHLRNFNKMHSTKSALLKVSTHIRQAFDRIFVLSFSESWVGFVFLNLLLKWLRATSIIGHSLYLLMMNFPKLSLLSLVFRRALSTDRYLLVFSSMAFNPFSSSFSLTC